MARVHNSMMFLLLSCLLRQKGRSAAGLARIRAATYYVQGVKHLRQAVLVCMGLLLCLLFMAGGFVLLHIGLVMCLPWASQHRGVLLAVLGGLYLLIPFVALLALNSEGRWMRGTHADEYVRKAVKPIGSE